MKDYQLTKANIQEFMSEIHGMLESGNMLIVDVKNNKTRTLTQNASIHKYCTQLSEKFNAAGLDMQMVLAPGTSIPWNPIKVKEDIWRTVQIAATGKESTTDLNTSEVSQVYEIINRHLSQTFGVFVPFPSKETMKDIK